MNNEETRLINEEPINKTEAFNPAPLKSTKGKTFAAAAGGFVAGATVGVGGSAYASSTKASENVETSEIEGVDNNENEEETPTPEDVLLVNDDGVRFAHVDADSFNDAFAQARAQVGPGGVFEYEGKLYGTYYADEWDNMSAEERIDYQHRVNNLSATNQYGQSHANDFAEHSETSTEPISSQAEMISAEPVDNEIRVLGVEAVQNEAGEIMNVALLECEGDQALFIDVDNNGTIDVVLHDDNGDGEIQDSEIHDISEAGITVDELVQMHAAQEGDVLFASNDDMPDYINDADSIMTV